MKPSEAPDGLGLRSLHSDLERHAFNRGGATGYKDHEAAGDAWASQDRCQRARVAPGAGRKALEAQRDVMDLATLGLPVVGADRALEALGEVLAQVGDEGLSGGGEGGSGLHG